VLEWLEEGEVDRGRAFQESTRSHARRLGLEYESFDLRGVPGPVAFGRMLHARGFAGILLDRIMAPLAWDRFPWERFSVVAAGRQINEWPFDDVRESMASTIRHAFARVHALGYRRPGVCLVRHDPVLVDDRTRLGDVLAHNALHPELGAIPPFFEVVPPSGETPALLAQQARLVGWYREHRPDVVIGFTVGTHYVLRTAGHVAPRDHGFLCLHLQPHDPWQQGIAGYVDPMPAIIRDALDRLAFLIRHQRRGVPASRVEIITGADWIDGPTLPRRRVPRRAS
jgi:LacI family transcriptional regulator